LGSLILGMIFFADEKPGAAFRGRFWGAVIIAVLLFICSFLLYWILKLDFSVRSTSAKVTSASKAQVVPLKTEARLRESRQQHLAADMSRHPLAECGRFP
jgi:hypothetical protein